MCLLLPRVSQIKQKGSQDYPAFIENADEKLRAQLLPKWVKSALAEGVSLKKLIRKDGLGLLAKKEAIDWINLNRINRIVKQLTNKASSAKSLVDIWANPPSLKSHLSKRIKWEHIQDEADYFDKVKATLNTARSVHLVGGQYPSIELIGHNWSIILNHKGLIKTAYQYEKEGTTFSEIQQQRGHQVYGYHLSKNLTKKLGHLFGGR